MTVGAYRTFQSLVLGALGLFLLSRIWNGSILLYINQRFVWLVMFGAIGLLILSQAVLQDRLPAQNENGPGDVEHQQHNFHEHSHESVSGWNLWWLALPVLLGLLVPARPLGASALATRGISLSAPITARSGASFSLDLPPSERSVLDWTRAAKAVSDPYQYDGDPADVTGFVYHDPRLADGQFLVGRFTITCCVADAFAIGMVVHWQDAGSLPDNSWVRVQGMIEVVDMDGTHAPSIRALSVEPIQAPPQPYLYP